MHPSFSDEILVPPDKARPDVEWGLLKAIAAYPEGSAHLDDVADGLLTERLDVDRLLALALRHQMLSALAVFLRRRDLFSVIPAPATAHLLLTERAVRHRTELFVREAARIVTAFVGARIPVACTKGVIYHSTLYDGLGTRYLGDIDLMVHPENRDSVAAALGELGYLSKVTYDERGERFVDLPRNRLAVYSLFPDHLPHFHRPTGDSVVPYHRVDVAFSPTWHGSRWQLPMDQFLGELPLEMVLLGSERVALPTLSTGHSFLFLVLHLFREAWFANSVKVKDLKLPQFGDVVRFWDRLGEDGRLTVRGLIAAYGIVAPMAWVCHHTDALFGTDLVTELELVEVPHPRWAHTASGPGETLLGWHGDMDRRLRTPGPPSMWSWED